MPHLKSMQPFNIRMILPYIPPVLCAVATCHGEAVARDQEDVTRNGILVLQACTDEKTTAEHSREISLMFKGVLLNETIQALFKADRNHLYHAVLLAEVERMNHHEWFGLPCMQDYSKKIRNDRFPLTAAINPNAVHVIREVIIKEVGNLQSRNPQANIPGLRPFIPWLGLLVFIRFQSQLPQRFRAVFQRQALEVFGEGGAAMVFGHDFSRCFQTKNVFVRSDADGVLSGRGARNGSYFPADAFPQRAMGPFPMADPRQGMGYFMQDGVPDFMRRLQVGTDEMDGKSNAFFLKAAYAQPPPCSVPPELPVMQPVFIQFQTGIGFYLPETGWSAGLFIPHGHV